MSQTASMWADSLARLPLICSSDLLTLLLALMRRLQTDATAVNTLIANTDEETKVVPT
jgi:hypothetical protein